MLGGQYQNKGVLITDIEQLEQNQNFFQKNSFFRNQKQAKSTFNMRDCLPDYNPLQSRNSISTAASQNCKRENKIVKPNTRQKQFIQTYNSQNDFSSKNRFNTTNNNFSIQQQQQQTDSFKSISHNLLREDRKVNIEYLKFPGLKQKGDNQKKLDQQIGERKLTLNTIKTHNSFQSPKFNSLKQTLNQFNNTKNPIGNNFNSTDYQNYFENLKNMNTNPKFAQTQQWQNIDSIENLQIQGMVSPISDLQLKKQNSQGSIQGYQDTLNNTGNINTLNFQDDIQTLNGNLDTSRGIKEEDQAELQDSVKHDFDIENYMNRFNNTGRKAPPEPTFKLNKQQEFNQDNTQIVHNYLDYLNDKFSEPYFRSKMKKQQDEYNNQKLNQLMAELKYSNDDERSKLVKNKLKKNVTKIKNFAKIANFAKKKSPSVLLKNAQKQMQKEQQKNNMIYYESFIQDLCDNINQLIKIKGNLIHAGNKLKAVNGFNEKIKKLLFEGEKLYTYYTVDILRVSIERECIIRHIPQKKLIENPSLKEGDIDHKVIKKLFYFNKSLEEYLLQKNEDIEEDIKKGLINETQTISDKCFQLLLREQPRKQQEELIQIKQQRDPKPNYHNYTKIANQLERAEQKLQGKFEGISNINRHQCSHIDRIMTVYQQI